MLVTDPISELKRRFNSAAAKNVSATYLFQISGDGGGNFFAKIDKGTLDVVPFEAGKTPEADCKISVTVDDLQAIMTGKMSAMTAALSGILAVEGSLGLAMQLVPIFFEGQSNSLF
mgnify:CR=1 FL=1